MGYGVDETSFRGAFLDTCRDIVPKEDRTVVWNVMTAPELLAYGGRIALHATRYAQKHALSDQIGLRHLDWQDQTSPHAQLHIVDSLARWATFWGSRGHGSYPDF